MVFRVLLDLPQRRQRMFVLAAIHLEFRLCQQHGVGRLGSVLKGHAQPFIATLVLALQVCSTRGLQIAEQR